MLSIRRTLGAVAVLLLAAVPLAAQEDPGRVKHRNDCRLAQQVLTLGQPANKRDWALGIIGSCEGAAEVLSQLWNAPPSEDAELQQLYYASVNSKDPRVFSMALDVARGSHVPASVRLAAFGTVVTYVRPDLLMYLKGRSRLEGIPPLEWDNVWATLDHPLHLPGEVSLPPGAPDAVMALVADLRDGEGVDPLLRDAAFWLTDLFRFPN